MANVVRPKNTQKAIDELVRQEIELRKKSEEIEKMREAQEREIMKLEQRNNQILQLKGETEQREELKRALLETIEEGHFHDIDTALALFPKASQRVLERLGVDEDIDVFDAVSKQRKFIANIIFKKWLESDDFRAQMAVFRLTASTEDLVRLNAVQRKEVKAGDTGTMFDINIIRNKAEAAKFIEANEVDDDEEDKEDSSM